MVQWSRTPYGTDCTRKLSLERQLVARLAADIARLSGARSADSCFVGDQTRPTPQPELDAERDLLFLGQNQAVC